MAKENGRWENGRNDLKRAGGSEFTQLQPLPKGLQVQSGLQKMADPICAQEEVRLTLH